MKDLEHIALLIDADNTQIGKLEGVIQEISKHGRIVAKRAYANWSKSALKNWEGELKRLAIKPEQQFDYVVGKNATDIALVIDAMKLLNTGLYDCFALVSSDSDYTPLAITLHESGTYVMGVGEKKTPESFINSCDEFILLENIAPTKVKGKSPASDQSDRSAEKAQKSAKNDPMQEIHYLLKSAWYSYQDDDGFAYNSVAGSYIKRVKPDFDVRSYGFRRLNDLIAAFPDLYETKLSKDGNTKLYRCR